MERAVFANMIEKNEWDCLRCGYELDMDVLDIYIHSLNHDGSANVTHGVIHVHACLANGCSWQST